MPAPATPAPAPIAPAATSTPPAAPDLRQEVSQYGITWTFDRPYPVGRFVTGDWWVVGPVTVVRVTPEPGPASAEETATSSKSRYGASALVDDRRMRNGSMVLGDLRLAEAGKGRPNPGQQPQAARGSAGGADRGRAAPGAETTPGAAGAGAGDAGVPAAGGESRWEYQGYDSRPKNFHPDLSATFPCLLAPRRALISTISATACNAKGELATPFSPGEAGLFLCPKTLTLALHTAAVLTCLDQAPPADAFRPSYADGEQPLCTASQIRWDRLPRLAAVPSTPDFATIARLFERPWLDHAHSWLGQHTVPGRNQPNYGREFARLTSLAGLMLLLDVPEERKRPLMLGYLQLGIDLAGLARQGRQWFPDGGHWQGRKWPILFASMVLDRPDLRGFPALAAGQRVYGRLLYQPGPGEAPATTLFQEDVDSYYGLGGDGQRVLWQIGVHTGVRQPYEEKPRATHGKDEHFIDAYRANNLGSWAGAALAARFMRARSAWDHDAFFDLVDRWMQPSELYEVPKWYPKGCTRTVDPFVEEMWAAHRAQAPDQPGGASPPRKWVWNADLRGGHWAANPPVQP